MKIERVDAIEILTTQGTPSVKIELELEDERVFSGSTGYGTSLSGHEMFTDDHLTFFTTHDDQPVFTKSQYNCLNKAIKIDKALKNKELCLEEIDVILCELDETEDKSDLGMPIILATSIAAAKAESYLENLYLFQYIGKKIGRPNYEDYSLPVPLINIINGGAHSFSPTIPFQEILLIPDNHSEKNPSFAACIRNTQKIFFELQALLKKKAIFFGYGFEGGIVAPFDSIEQALDLLSESIEKSNLSDSFRLGVDCAANQWYDQKLNRYSLLKNGKKYTVDQLIQWYLELSSQYKIVYFEDPFAEDDFEGWSAFKQQFPGMLAGDDLCATNINYIKQALEKDCINSVIIKPTQVGTVSQTINAVKYARECGLEIIVSHRSCETDEIFIADFALGVYADFCKFGNITQLNIEKYNRLLEFDFDTACGLLKMSFAEQKAKKEQENNI